MVLERGEFTDHHPTVDAQLVVAHRRVTVGCLDRMVVSKPKARSSHPTAAFGSR
jgi:hypothetical protein